MHRFIIPQFFSGDVWGLTDRDLIRQWTLVLKFTIGEKIVLGDGNGKIVECEIVSMNKKSIQVKVGEIQTASKPKRNSRLYCAILKRENFEWVVQKATELGVGEIIPLITDRTIKTGVNFDRLHIIIKEACEQSHRAYLPILHPTEKFVDALKKAKDSSEVWLAHYGGEKITSVKQTAISVFVGPEGGWSENELELARAAQVKTPSLGPTVLRAETAAVVASFLAING